MNRSKTIVVAFLVTLWVAFIVASYYVYHKPWESRNLPALTALLDFSLAVLLVSLAGGIGRKIISKFPGGHPLELLAIQVALGLGVLGLAVLAFGLAGFLNPWIAWLALIIGIVLFKRDIRKWLGNWSIIKQEFDQIGRFGKVTACFVVILISFQLVIALSPPIAWDSLVYHLELPRQYLIAGRVLFVSGNLNTGMPQLAHMLYTWSMALNSGSTAATTSWMVSLVAFAGAGGFARRYLSPDATWIVPAFLLAGSSLAGGMSSAYTDLWNMLFGLCAIIAIDHYFRTRFLGWLVISGLMAGFALGVKYNGGILILLILIFIVVGWFQNRYWIADQFPKPIINFKPLLSGILIDVFLFVSVALLVFSPWLIKNLVFTGNPIYPFFITGLEMDAIRQSFHQGFSPERSFIDALFLPFMITYKGVEGAGYYMSNIGPLLLAFLPFVFIGWGSLNRDIRSGFVRLLLVALGSWTIWAIFLYIADPFTRTRHYFIVFPVYSLLSVAGFLNLSKLDLPNVRLGRVMSIFVTFVLLLAFLEQGFAFLQKNPLPVVSGYESEKIYLERSLSYHFLAMQAVNNLPENSKVQFLWEPRVFYCSNVVCKPDEILDEWWYRNQILANSSEISVYYLSQGFSHVLLFDVGAEFVRNEVYWSESFTTTEWDELERFKKDELILIEDLDGVYSLYEIIRRD
jgi:hypothetical protein